MKRRRGHIISILDHLTRDIGSLLILLVLVITRGVEQLFDNFTLPAFLLIAPISSIISYFVTYYTITEEVLIIETGLFTKKKTEIPLSAITTVDLSQNIVFQIFGIYKIKIDNASQINKAEKKEEAAFALEEAEAMRVKELLLSKRNSTVIEEAFLPERKVVYTGTTKDFILFGLLKSKLGMLFSGLGLIFVVFGYISDAENGLEDKIFNQIEIFVQNNSLTAIILFIAAFLLFAFVVSIIMSVIRNFNYKISCDIDTVYIEYGLFKKKSYSLRKSKISGLKINQSLLMMFAGFYTADVFAIGYGDNSDKNETAMLFPIANKELMKKIINELFPELIIGDNSSQEFIRPGKGALRYFFYNFKIVFGIVILTYLSFTRNIALISAAVVLLVLILLSCILQYKNTGVHIAKNNLTATKGAYNRTITLLNISKLESVSETASYFKHKRGFTTIKISSLAPLVHAKQYIRNMPLNAYEKVKQIIQY